MNYKYELDENHYEMTEDDAVEEKYCWKSFWIGFFAVFGFGILKSFLTKE